MQNSDPIGQSEKLEISDRFADGHQDGYEGRSVFYPDCRVYIAGYFKGWKRKQKAVADFKIFQEQTRTKISKIEQNEKCRN